MTRNSPKNPNSAHFRLEENSKSLPTYLFYVKMKRLCFPSPVRPHRTYC